MPLEFRCPGCRGLFRTGDEVAGKQVRCRRCGTVRTAPAAPLQSAGPPPLPPRPRRTQSEEDYDDRPRGRRTRGLTSGQVLGLTVAAGLGFCLCGGTVGLALYPAKQTQMVAVVAPPAGATDPDPEVVPPPERPPEFPGDRPGGPGKAADAPPDPRGPAPNPDAIRDGRFVRPGAARSPTSYLRAVSTKGDSIGAGQTFNVGKGGMTLAVTRRGVMVSVPGLGLSFGGPRDTFLTAGQYPDARRLPFSGDGPGIEITTPGRGCNSIHGSFAVWEIEVAGNRVVRLAIDFVQHCEGAGPPLYGSVRFNSAFK